MELATGQPNKLLGSASTAAATDHQYHVALPYLLEALRAIPQHEKLEYLEALRVAPQLVQTESDPVAFLRFCDWDAKAAARRITVYWRNRKEVFGKTRAFLPLEDVSGNGALGREEIETLMSGCFCLMPNDTHNRGVFYVDRQRFPPSLSERGDVKLRSVFWVLHKLSQCPISQTTGCVAVIKRDMAHCTENIREVLVHYLRDVFPLRFQATHVIFLGEKRSLLRTFVVPFILENVWGVFSRVNVHDCESAEQVVAKLARHGISRESLPRRLGGFVETDPASSRSPPDSGMVADGGQSTPPLSGMEIDTQFMDVSNQGSGDHWQGLAVQPILSIPQQLQRHSPTHADSDALFNKLLGNDSLKNEGCPFEPIPIHQPEVSIDNDCPFEPIPIRTSSPPPQPEASSTSTRLDMDSVIFSDHVLDMVTTDSEDDSPFEPRPIRSPPNQQGTAFHSTPPTSGSIEDAILLDRDNPSRETEEVLKLSLATLDEGMSCISVIEKAAYEEAVRRAPAVVRTESDPLAYLHFEKSNAWTAAERLALYWTYRVQHFGERAFFPLTQTMGGALWEEDIRTLASGAFFFLPSDSRGRPVLCFDPAKRPEDTSKPSLIRVAFYFFSIVWCEHPVAMTEGCIFIVFTSTGIMELSKFIEDTRNATEIAMSSFPIKNCETHVIYSTSANVKPLPSVATAVIPKILNELGRLLSHDRAQFHVGDTSDELRRKLALCGLSGAALQAAVNGGTSDHDFAQWMRHRQLIESQRCAQGQQQLKKQPRSPPSPPLSGGTTQHRAHALHEQTPQQQVPLPTPIAEGSLQHGSHGQQHQQHQQHQPQPHPPFAAAVPEDLAHGTQGRSQVSVQQTPVDLWDISAAMQFVPSSDKKAYLEAMDKAPNLVEKESDPVRFLKLENYNEIAAARRVAAYWRIRCEVFGNRAFLPMDQTAEGALDRKDVAVLQTGFVTQLPNDASGLSVVCCDGSRLEKRSSAQSQLHVMFYLWSLISQNSRSVTEGYSVLYVATSTAFDKAFSGYLKLVMEVHPVKLKGFHLLGCCPDGTSKSDYCEGMVKPMIASLDWSVQEKTAVHVCGTRVGFADQLVGHGMWKESVPKAFGGKWGLEEFVEWQELRIRSEWDLPIGDHGCSKVAERYGIPTAPAPSVSSLTDEEKTERNRRSNVLRSRRKRERDRIQVHVLREQCDELKEEQKALVQEGRQLELLLETAVGEVANSQVYM